jgi:hypothetical protein
MSIGNISDIMIHGRAPNPAANIITNVIIPINAKVGVTFTLTPGTPFNPNANAREIQPKHKPNADA